MTSRGSCRAYVALIAVLTLGGAEAAEPPPRRPSTMAQASPRPALCPSPAAFPEATVVRLAPQPATNLLGPSGTQLWAGSPVRRPVGGPALMRSGQYIYIVTRSLRHSDFVRRDPRSGNLYHPVDQTDTVRWTPVRGQTVGYQRYTRGPRNLQGGPVWFTEPPLRQDAPNRSDGPTAAGSVDASSREPLASPPSSVWPADPATLAAQIGALSPEPRPTYVLQAIASRYTRYLPTPAQHTAALTVLCSTPGVWLAGPVIDQAGRPGIAVRAEHDFGDGVVQHGLLILDPHTWRPQSWSLTWTGWSNGFTDDHTTLLMDAGYRTVLTARTPA